MDEQGSPSVGAGARVLPNPEIPSSGSLGRFIASNIEPIMAEWERFAGTLAAGKGKTSAALRNDAERMLRFIVADMQKAQSPEQQRAKGEGRGPKSNGDTAAHDHGIHRLGEGFDMNQMLSEYRALRASVVRLWAQSNDYSDDDRLNELIRFNEAMDQQLAESVVRFTGKLDRTKDLFLAVLGHDLRTPLAAVAMSSKAMLATPGMHGNLAESARVIDRSAARMERMIRDLLDFTRTRLGTRLPVKIVDCDLKQLAHEAVEEVEAAWPGRSVILRTEGALSMQCDNGRLRQLVANLIGNALQHGYHDTPVTVIVASDPHAVTLSVHNYGPALSPEETRTIFDPMVRARSEGDAVDADGTSMGLGLYIAREIATAHGGAIQVSSSPEEGTRFTVRLPRQLPPTWGTATHATQ